MKISLGQHNQLALIKRLINTYDSFNIDFFKNSVEYDKTIFRRAQKQLQQSTLFLIPDQQKAVSFKSHLLLKTSSSFRSKLKRY